MPPSCTPHPLAFLLPPRGWVGGRPLGPPKKWQEKGAGGKECANTNVSYGKCKPAHPDWIFAFWGSTCLYSHPPPPNLTHGPTGTQGRAFSVRQERTASPTASTHAFLFLLLLFRRRSGASSATAAALGLCGGTCAWVCAWLCVHVPLSAQSPGGRGPKSPACPLSKCAAASSSLHLNQ